MDLKSLFEMQKVLDYRIEQEHPREDGEDRLAKKLLALQVELGELANEWRGFKFWSTNQQPNNQCRKCKGTGYCHHFGYADNNVPCEFCEGYPERNNPLLEEYVDVIHFSISIAIELGLTTYRVTNLDDLRYHKNSVLKTFSMVYRDINELQYYENAERYIRDYLDGVLGLGYKLGFTFEEIEQAYISKNQTNHERQNNGY